LTLYKRNEDLRAFTNFTYSLFLELLPKYGESWTKQVENKLTAQVCEQLTYSEKIKILDLPFVEVVFDNNRDMVDAVMTLAMFPYITKYTFNRVERW
jgi:FKBP-type peptidyl-prolyl cis-trans isomerase (trigger factor)